MKLIDYKIFFTIIFLLATFHLPAEEADSLKKTEVDSVRVLFWQPKVLPELNPFDPDNLSNYFELNRPNTNKTLKYYNPENVMPKKFWELDYRQSSYYTPRIVNDKLARIMDRPSPDSFVPLPGIALLAASIALKHMDIQKKIEIKANDYLIDGDLEEILFSLWKKSPQTIEELYSSGTINQDRTVLTLEFDLETLIDKKLVKRKKIENEPAKYFAAQNPKTVDKLIENALEYDTIPLEQRQKLAALREKLSIFK